MINEKCLNNRNNKKPQREQATLKNNIYITIYIRRTEDFDIDGMRIGYVTHDTI